MYKLIALDLDGTLLNDKKQLSERNRKALLTAYERGAVIVPTTGRFFGGMPQEVRSLPCVRYAITINGAQVEDRESGEVLYRGEIENARAIEIMQELDKLPVIYDCYMENWGYMTKAHYERCGEYARTPQVLDMLLKLRKPVPELKAFLKEQGKNAQKIQCFFHSIEERKENVPMLCRLFPDMLISSALGNNVEINAPAANKGDALLALCRHLGIEQGESLAFGDGLNDLSMIEKAGLGVCMENGDPEVKALAGRIAPHCNEDGVGRVIELLIQEGQL